MYGTVVHFLPKAGQETAIEELTRSGVSARGSTVPGFLGSYLVKPEANSDEWLGLVIFDSASNYRKNAADPEQDRWYRRFREALTADPVWIDGDILAMEPAAVPL